MVAFGYQSTRALLLPRYIYQSELNARINLQVDKIKRFIYPNYGETALVFSVVMDIQIACYSLCKLIRSNAFIALIIANYYSIDHIKLRQETHRRLKRWRCSHACH
jgi:hypothetical protein